jgi:RES domain-containing protein
VSKIIWRICESAFGDRAFSGEGARIVGGRWNSKGQRMVYTAEHLSLAILEVFVHLNVPTVERDFFVAIQAEISGGNRSNIRILIDYHQIGIYLALNLRYHIS